MGVEEEEEEEKNSFGTTPPIVGSIHPKFSTIHQL